MNYEQTRNAKETHLRTYNPNKDATHFERKNGFERQRKTRNTLRKLMLHTCMLLTWGGKCKYKVNYAKQDENLGKPWKLYSPNMYTSDLGRKTKY